MAMAMEFADNRLADAGLITPAGSQIVGGEYC